MGIIIGNNNKIKNSIISDGDSPEVRKNWVERHPIIINVLISFGV